MPHSYNSRQPCPYRCAGQCPDCRRLLSPSTREQVTTLNCDDCNHDFKVYGPVSLIRGPQYHPGCPERERVWRLFYQREQKEREKKEREKKEREKRESERRERAIKEERAKADRERRDEEREKEDRENKRREEETRKREQMERRSERRR
ncbi:hypothetical protein WAI453_013257 [Rhynchosporium graminicola]|uniref:Uncharacterized protein n=1 Tax=Rhynchosporium graminicola TaxID=2792576 RepID=A0A1E1LSW0_9HELO|nr:uncharacterized protein RCO7_10832 [Rhynchosporium commune]